MTELIEKVERFIADHHIPQNGDAVVLAVSGGVDSMVMLDLFCRLRLPMNLRLIVAHVNHALRGIDSDRDQAFVEEACLSRSLPCIAGPVDVAGRAAGEHISIQTAARDLRYAFLERARMERGASAVATAHHADDNAETVLLNIMRGTGLRGLGGIPPVRRDGMIIRPLIGLRRRDIEAYADERAIAFRLDESNLHTAYARNELRLSIFPALQSGRRMDICEALASTASVMADVVGTIDRMLDMKAPEAIGRKGDGSLFLRLPPWRALDGLLQEHLLLNLLRHAGIEPSEERIVSIHGLAARQTGRRVDLGSGWEAWRDREQITLVRRTGTPGFEIPIVRGGTYAFEDFTLSVGNPEPVPSPIPADAATAFVDADRITGALCVRSWRKGDWFVPLGSGHRKKVSDLFIECKVPLHRKPHIPLVASGGDILWVCGMRLDDRFKLTPETRHAVKITYRPTGGPFPS